jgi:DNA modification methylase
MDLGKIYKEAQRLWRATPHGDVTDEDNLLLLGDNLSMMAALSSQIGAGTRTPLNLIYMDPPYFTNRDPESRIKIKTHSGDAYIKAQAFSDTWVKRGLTLSRKEALADYLAMLTPRIIAARDLLAEDGVLWLHLDRRAVHYARVMADIVFGEDDHLINEVIWFYKSGGSSTRRFANKHDTLLFYAKNKKKYKFFPQEEKSYNRGLKPYRFKGVKEYRDDQGWYTIVNMKDVWEIPMVGRTAKERTGYATQKPEALLERIILSCTEAGDFCMDPFGGSGTLAAVCQRLGRNWISIDNNIEAIETAAKRLELR